MTTSRYEIHFMHDNSSYKVALKEMKQPGIEGALVLNGRSYDIKDGTQLPDCAKEFFSALRTEGHEDEQKLLKRASALNGFDNVSITKQTYDIAEDRLIGKQSFDSEASLARREKAVKELKRCEPGDKDSIRNIVSQSQCSELVLFEIADQFQKKGQVELAHALREAARPFDLPQSIHIICDRITQHHYSPEKGKEIADAFRLKFAENAYEDIYEADEFAFRATHDLQEIGHDLHFAVDAKGPQPLAVDSQEEKETEMKRLEANHFGFGQLEYLKEEKACLLSIHKFENPNFQFEGKNVSREKAVSLLNEMKKAEPEAIIFDLTQNSGGSGYMAELFVSYFHEADILLATFEYRNLPKSSEVFPTEPKETYSYERLPKEERMLSTPVYILTSAKTMSAGEGFACHFKGLNQDNNRVTLIGERTAGAANVTELLDAGPSFNVAVPIGEEVVPYPGYQKNWEGTGVEPHIETKVDEALDKAKSMIREKSSH